MAEIALTKMYTQATVEKGSFDETERTFTAWASKPVLDRDGEIIAHDAWEVDNFKSNPVLLWAHDYSMPPVGKVLWVKQQKNGLKFMPKFAPTDMGKELFQLYFDGFLNTFSVGFIPKDFEEDEEETVQFMGWFGDIFEKPVLTYTDVELLEISCVPVPSCPAALVERMASGQIKAKGLKKAIADTASKTVIPFKKYDLDPEDAIWDGPAERKEADTEDLLLMSTWYDAESPDAKSSYKLPHHRAEGHNTVWRGVATAMVALLGGRGGVDIPDDDRRGVHSHLSKHYGEFDKPVPEFKHYTEADLKAMDLDGETVKTSGGDVEGVWEAVEEDDRDPVEIMRQAGLEKEQDGIIPVGMELWNTIFDRLDDATPKEQEEALVPVVEGELVEYTAEEMSLLVQQEIKIRERDEIIKEYGHMLKVVKAKLRVAAGGIG